MTLPNLNKLLSVVRIGSSHFFACSLYISGATGFFHLECRVSLTKSKQIEIRVQNV